MIRFSQAIKIAAALTAAVICAVATNAAAAPIDAYVHHPNADAAAISPDGKKIAIVQSAGGDNRMIAFYPLDGTKPSRVDLGEMKARDLVWVSNTHVIVWASVTREYVAPSGQRSGYTFEFERVMSVNEKTGEIAWLFSKEKKFSLMIGAPRLLHTLPDDPTHVLMSYYDPFSGKNTKAVGGTRLGGNSLGSEFALTVYRADITDGTVQKVEGGNKHTAYYVADANANLRFRNDYLDTYDKREIYYREADNGRFSKVDEFPEEDGEESRYYLRGLSPEGTNAYVLARGDDHRFKLLSYGLDGKIGEVVFGDDAHDVGGALIDPHTTAVIGARIVRDLPEQVFFDKQLASVQASLKAAFKDGRSVLIDSYSQDKKMLLVRMLKPGAPGELFLFDAEKKELSALVSDFPNIPANELGSIGRYDYQSSDGLVIPGYLTIPNGKPKKSLPLIVVPHGGPWARDSMRFDWIAQFFAGRGYAVYQPNFRGSDGYGLAFREAGYKQWGLKMQDDITEGVEKLVADGVIDRNRICIFGGSYGGYAALMGGAKTPELYKCVISYAGVTDIPDLIEYDKTYSGRSSEGVVFMRHSIGENRADLKAVSPATNAEKFAAPVLLIHGKDDTVVPISQSRKMESALRAAGKPVEFIELAGEDHWLSTYSTRRAMLEATEAFLQQHLAGD